MWARWGRAVPLLVLLSTVIMAAAGDIACTPPQAVQQRSCQDPTHDGACFCPVGASCHHRCGEGIGHCTLGCSQRNLSCSVTGSNDCTALCAGAGRCEATCGPNSSVSCQWVTERCTAAVGNLSRVNCEGSADCEVTCTGACTVSCSAGHCRLRCAPGEDCDMDCGGVGPAETPITCPDGSKVCGRLC